MLQTKLNYEELNNVNVDRKTLAQLLLVNEKYINELSTERGLPRIDYNTYRLIDVLTWYFKYKDELTKKIVEKIKSTKPQDELALKSARLKELEILEREGKLIDIEEVKLAWISEYKKFEELLEGMLARLIIKVPNKNVDELRVILKEEIDALKQAIVELPLPDAENFEGENE